MGILDGPMRELATQLTGLFVDNASVVTSKATTYNSVTDAEVVVTRELSVPFTPPERVSQKMVAQNDNLRATDVVTFAAAAAFEAAVPAFDPVPSSTASIYVRQGGRDHQVVEVRAVWSGDQVALYEFILRS